MSTAACRSGRCACATRSAATDPAARNVRQRAVLAIRICRTCPIETQCLDYALRHYVTGIWGGTTERQRQAIRRERGIVIQQEINHGTPGGYRTHRRRGEIPCAECHAASVRDNRRKHALATLTPKGDRL